MTLLSYRRVNEDRSWLYLSRYHCRELPLVPVYLLQVLTSPPALTQTQGFETKYIAHQKNKSSLWHTEGKVTA